MLNASVEVFDGRGVQDLHLPFSEVKVESRPNDTQRRGIGLARGITTGSLGAR